MLPVAENEMLCRVGAGTPMGELLRRFWLPALPSEQLADYPSAPVRLRILGEDLVAFRSSKGDVGIVEPLCPHRRAPLFLGRNEEDGLRCIYHGWKFDTNGACIDLPNVQAANDQLKKRMCIKSYPTVERGDIIWIYMGAAENMPEMPDFEWMRVPSEQRSVSVWTQESNWVQGVEGEIDSSHVSFLHSDYLAQTPDIVIHRKISATDPSPKIIVKPTEYGFLSAARRNAGNGEYYWRITQWLMPFHNMIPSAEWPALGGRMWVPIDDYTTYTWDWSYSREKPLDERFWELFHSGRSFPPKRAYGPMKLHDGKVIDTWRPICNADNDYRLDREGQFKDLFSGLYGVNDQDRAVQEGMGPIVDRSKENLVASDAAVVAARRTLMDWVKRVQNGEPVLPALDGSMYDVKALDVISPHAELDDLLASDFGDMSTAWPNGAPAAAE